MIIKTTGGLILFGRSTVLSGFSGKFRKPNKIISLCGE
jgi:hypothetical protein